MAMKITSFDIDGVDLSTDSGIAEVNRFARRVDRRPAARA